MKSSQRGDGIWHGVQGIGTGDQIEALGWKGKICLRVRTQHHMFEPKVGNPGEAFVCHSQHLLTPINAK
jgi:hypothetical protein